MTSQLPDIEPENRDAGGTRLSPWLVAILLIVCGVIIARVVRAALAPALRPQEPVGFEMHLV
jgi:hypothetical protein